MPIHVIVTANDSFVIPGIQEANRFLDLVDARGIGASGELSFVAGRRVGNRFFFAMYAPGDPEPRYPSVLSSLTEEELRAGYCLCLQRWDDLLKAFSELAAEEIEVSKRSTEGRN
jgi:hypothetical protein